MKGNKTESYGRESEVPTICPVTWAAKSIRRHVTRGMKKEGVIAAVGVCGAFENLWNADDNHFLSMLQIEMRTFRQFSKKV